MKVFIFIVLLSSSIIAHAANSADQIKALHELSYTLLDTDKDSAFQIGVKTELMSRKEGLIWEEANSIFIQAWVLENSGSSGEAFKMYIIAIELLEKNGLKNEREQKLYLQLTRNIGYILLDHEAFNSAQKIFERGLTRAFSFNNINEASRLLVSLSQIHQERKNFTRSTEYINRALSLTDKIEEKNLIIILNQKGINEKNQSLYAESRETYRNLIERISNNSELVSYIGTAQHNIAHSYMVEGLLDSAVIFHLREIETNKLFFDPQAIFIAFLDLSEAYLNLGSYQKSITSGERAAIHYENVRLHPEHFFLFNILSKAHTALEQYEKAQYYSERYMEENEKYLKAKEMLAQIKEKYQMEELAASFLSEKPIVEEPSHFWVTLFIISAGLSIILLIGKSKTVKV